MRHNEESNQAPTTVASIRSSLSLATLSSTGAANPLIGPARFSQYTIGVVIGNTFGQISFISMNLRTNFQITIITMPMPMPEPAASSSAGHSAAAENNLEQARATHRDRVSYFEICLLQPT